MRIVGQEQIADFLGVAPKTIVEWQEQGLPIEVRGGPHVPSEYDSVACISWMIDRALKKAGSERPQDREARLNGDLKEILLAEKRGTLISVQQIEPKLRAAIVAAREFWRNEPTRLAREVPGKPIQEIEGLLSTSFEGFLVKLSRWPQMETVDDTDEENGQSNASQPQ